MSSADRNRKVTAAMGRDAFHQALSEATNELESRVFEMGSLRQIGQLFENSTEMEQVGHARAGDHHGGHACRKGIDHALLPQIGRALPARRG